LRSLAPEVAVAEVAAVFNLAGPIFRMLDSEI
jgi:hypothetical protein